MLAQSKMGGARRVEWMMMTPTEPRTQREGELGGKEGKHDLTTDARERSILSGTPPRMKRTASQQRGIQRTALIDHLYQPRCHPLNETTHRKHETNH